ncbi:hypothetical protein ACQ4PT_050008 [Festuca glaucescens]
MALTKNIRAGSSSHGGGCARCLSDDSDEEARALKRATSRAAEIEEEEEEESEEEWEEEEEGEEDLATFSFEAGKKKKVVQKLSTPLDMRMVRSVPKKDKRYVAVDYRTMASNEGYMPPEYVDSGFISKKFDVFSFGVIIIKILAGDMGYFQCTQMSPEKFAEIVSENWKERLQLIPGYSSREMDIKQIRRCTEIAIKCVDTDPQKRPCVTDIVHELEELEVEKKKMSEALILLGSCDRKVVSLDPNLELCFLFESRKELSCCLQITNQTDDFIAFNVKINRNKYSVQPSQGTMPPRSKRYIIVTMEAQAKAPPNMRCHDILLLQSTSVSGIDEVDYQELFKMSRADKVVDVVKLPIVYAIVSTTKD